MTRNWRSARPPLARRNKGSKNPENDGRCRRRGKNEGGEARQDSGQQV